MKNKQNSPYLSFSRSQWKNFRQDMPLTLGEADLMALHGRLEVVSLAEVEEIYLPLSRLLSFYVTARQNLYHATSAFLGTPEAKVPYIIGVAGSVAVGKSTTSRVLQALLSRWPNHPHVVVVTTDGFVYPNAQLETLGIMNRKGFPESYDVQALLQLLHDIKAGKHPLQAPVYSHHHYDIVPEEFVTIDRPDIVIVEGLNILQTGATKINKLPKVFVSDYFDFTVFVDAEVSAVKQWYIDRVVHFYNTDFQRKDSYFHHLTELTPDEVVTFAERVWREINEVNLFENILPYKQRAQLILHKNAEHAVDEVKLRKL